MTVAILRERDHTAMEKAGGVDAVMIGDSVWDWKAAKRAKVPALAC